MIKPIVSVLLVISHLNVANQIDHKNFLKAEQFTQSTNDKRLNCVVDIQVLSTLTRGGFQRNRKECEKLKERFDDHIVKSCKTPVSSRLTVSFE